MAEHTHPADREAATSVPSPRAPDARTLRRRSEDPTLGDGAKPPTSVGWGPTPTLTDRRGPEAPAYVALEPGAPTDSPAARVAEGLEALGRSVERVSPEQVPRRAPTATNSPLVVHVGDVDPVRGPEAVDVYRSGATVSYAVPQGAEESRVQALLARADVVTVAAGDLARLHPGEEAASTVRRWLTAGPSVVVVTGADGARATNAVGTTAEVRGDHGGDHGAFVAGVLDALWSGGLLGVHAREDLRTLVAGTLQELLDNAAASAEVARTTGRPATRAELTEARGVPRLGTV
ncbi:hypothetical protein FE251_07625 [Georgenia wutianyii]|uniref:Carbohydrate kinase PfkB domain-containing protein n=1 Tax=Georgenia wutianyii TaxID=2585135 RepID=A0ABX5VLA2_9MICO|nr:hypothetical protein [Georgenia wutianyii]QDB79252.1 hypothetical protein FE251_07625 [Georgenia wutianyii]